MIELDEINISYAVHDDKKNLDWSHDSNIIYIVDWDCIAFMINLTYAQYTSHFELITSYFTPLSYIHIHFNVVTSEWIVIITWT